MKNSYIGIYYIIGTNSDMGPLGSDFEKVAIKIKPMGRVDFPEEDLIKTVQLISNHSF